MRTSPGAPRISGGAEVALAVACGVISFSAVAVVLSVAESVTVAVLYFIVAEALTNAVKHARRAAAPS